MSYLDLAKAARPVTARPEPRNGREALGELEPDPGASVSHPWRGLIVNVEEGRGELVWTDGIRAAVCPFPEFAWLVDLETVRLVEDES